MTIIRKTETLILEDDREGGCYRVTCADGYCLEQPDATGCNGLHELVSDYHADYTKAEALRGARRDFNESLKHVEKCEADNCEWCHPEHPDNEVGA